MSALPSAIIDSSLFRRHDHADDAGREARLAFDLLGDRHIVAGPRRRPHVRRDAAGGCIDVVESARLEYVAQATASAAVMPPSAQSLPVMRAPSAATVGGTACRTASATSRGKRMRFPAPPP